MSHNSRTVARYLLEKAQEQGRSLTPMKLIKLVYIAHGWMLGMYGQPLIRENVEAWEYGPVVPDLYQAVKRFRASPIPPEEVGPSIDDEEFDELEEGVMNETLDIYGRRTAMQLSRMTHASNTPWDITYNRIGRSFVISNDLIEDHYEQLYEAHSDHGPNG